MPTCFSSSWRLESLFSRKEALFSLNSHCLCLRSFFFFFLSVWFLRKIRATEILYRFFIDSGLLTLSKVEVFQLSFC
ncbi:unnamed protein product [Citrullus colocynthis]|uniref:Uncharacterized protein n=1 Tax=Citrullus colocynthis TaxID=252529 RepID=A0ABP0YKQ8_9ROSI